MLAVLGVAPAVVANHLEHLLAAALHRIERGHGFLENHGYAFATDGAQGLLVEGKEVGGLMAIGQQGTAGYGGLTGQQAHQGQGAHALAAAALAHDAQGAATGEGEADLLDHLAAAEGHREALHIEQCVAVVTHLVWVGYRVWHP